jgi:salicylate hydroxylase
MKEHSKSKCTSDGAFRSDDKLHPRRDSKVWKSAVEMRRMDDKVWIRFADGKTAEANAVVGCDGGKGVSREAVLGERWPDKASATYDGRYVYRTIVPMKEARDILGTDTGDGKMFIGPGRYFASYQMSQGMQLNILAARQNGEPWTHNQWRYEVTKEEMLKDFDGCDTRLLQLLDVNSCVLCLQHFCICIIMLTIFFRGHTCLRDSRNAEEQGNA